MCVRICAPVARHSFFRSSGGLASSRGMVHQLAFFLCGTFHQKPAVERATENHSPTRKKKTSDKMRTLLPSIAVRGGIEDERQRKRDYEREQQGADCGQSLLGPHCGMSATTTRREATTASAAAAVGPKTRTMVCENRKDDEVEKKAGRWGGYRKTKRGGGDPQTRGLGRACASFIRVRTGGSLGLTTEGLCGSRRMCGDGNEKRVARFTRSGSGSDSVMRAMGGPGGSAK